MIQACEPADSTVLVQLASETGVFKPHEIVALEEVLVDYHTTNRELGHVCVRFVSKAGLEGFAYYAPASMAERAWYLYWIAVSKLSQARGIGSQLLTYAEQDIRQRDGRLLLIETSSLPYYDLTRKFYLKHGYDQAATIADFYADGDSMVVFSKRMDRAK